MQSNGLRYWAAGESQIERQEKLASRKLLKTAQTPRRPVHALLVAEWT